MPNAKLCAMLPSLSWNPLTDMNHHDDNARVDSAFRACCDASLGSAEQLVRALQQNVGHNPAQHTMLLIACCIAVKRSSTFASHVTIINCRVILSCRALSLVHGVHMRNTNSRCRSHLGASHQARWAIAPFCMILDRRDSWSNLCSKVSNLGS